MGENSLAVLGLELEGNLNSLVVNKNSFDDINRLLITIREDLDNKEGLDLTEPGLSDVTHLLRVTQELMFYTMQEFDKQLKETMQTGDLLVDELV